MPLLGGFEYHFLVAGPYDEDLRVAELCYVEEGVGRIVCVGGQERGARGGSAVPFLRLGRGFLGVLEGGLEVGDGIGFVGRVVFRVFDFECPEVQD